MPSYSAETNKGTITSYLSVPSGPAVPGCASATISYVDENDPKNGTGPFIGAVYDVYWGKDVNTSMHCLPDQVTTSIMSYDWASSRNNVVTYLGPFDCPASYTTAKSSIYSNWGTMFYCCPSNYDYGLPLDSKTTTWSECRSMLTVGQTVTDVDDSGSTAASKPSTTIITESQAKITAFPLVGVKRDHPTATKDGPDIGLPTGLGDKAKDTVNKAKGFADRFTLGAKIGVGVGALVLFLAIVGLITFCCMRHRRKRTAGRKYESVGLLPVQTGMPPPAPRPYDPHPQAY